MSGFEKGFLVGIMDTMRNTYVEVSLLAIKNNFAAIKELLAPQTKICAVVKADAYGHGMVRVAKTLEEKGVDCLAVALVEEGMLLRKEGIVTPILVLGPIAEKDIESCLKNDLTLTVSSKEKLFSVRRVAIEYGKAVKIHLKIDTGMGRIGVHWDRANTFIDEAVLAEQGGYVVCEGIYSHFSHSMDAEYTKVQFDRFQTCIVYAESVGLAIPLRHICSSRSIVLYPEYHLTMVRPGIILYGIEPETNHSILNAHFLPALSWKTVVAYFKVIQKGEFVGYGNTWTPSDAYARIITLPVGYADGFPRRLSNNGMVCVGGKKYPIVGRVCMDQVMVSLGINGEAYLDDEVVLIGKQGEQTIFVEDIARLIDTTPHEIPTTISGRVPRVYSE